jgi:hypothetical protein
MASSTENESRLIRGMNDPFICSLGVDVKHRTPVTPILVYYGHIPMAQELVSCVSVLPVGSPLGKSAVAVDWILHLASAYHQKTPTTPLLPHLSILHSSIINARVHHRYFGRSELDVCFNLRCPPYRLSHIQASRTDSSRSLLCLEQMTNDRTSKEVVQHLMLSRFPTWPPTCGRTRKYSFHP